MLDAILVGYDGSESAVAALAFASRLAVKERAKLIVGYVLTPAADGDGLPASRAEGERWMENAIQQVAAEVPSDVEKLVVDRGDVTVTDALLDLSSDCAVDLIVVGRTEARGRRQVLGGTIADRLVERADCSVAICPQSSPNLDISDLIVDFDESEAANEALRKSAALAHTLRAPLHLVGVVPSPPRTSLGGPHEINRGSVRQHQRERLARARDALTTPLNSVFVEVREGEVARELIAFASRLRSPMIVLGHRGPGGFIGLHLPSLRREVVRRARGPVLIARRQVAPRSVRESARDRGDERQPITVTCLLAGQDALVRSNDVARSHPRPPRVERARPSAIVEAFEEPMRRRAAPVIASTGALVPVSGTVAQSGWNGGPLMDALIVIAVAVAFVVLQRLEDSAGSGDPSSGSDSSGSRGSHSPERQREKGIT